MFEFFSFAGQIITKPTFAPYPLKYTGESTYDFDISPK